MPKYATLEKVYQDMKHGVYNFTENGRCTCCGNCCTALLPMTKVELKIRGVSRLILKQILSRNHLLLI